MSRRAVELIFVTAVLAAEVVGAILLIHASNHEPHRVLASSLAITAGVSFVFAGMIALHLRPENPTGLYLALVGFLWFFGALPEANNNVVYTIGAFLEPLLHPFRGADALLPHRPPRPDGQADREGDRVVRRPRTADRLPLQQDAEVGVRLELPGERDRRHDSPTLARVVELTASAVTAAIIGSVVVVLARRWRAATAPARRVLPPVYAAGRSRSSSSCWATS